MERPLSDVEKALPPLRNPSSASLSPPPRQTQQSTSSHTSEITLHQRPVTLETGLAKWFTNRFAPSHSTTLGSSLADKPEDSLQGSRSASDPCVVDWTDGDPGNPYNWNKAFKWALTAHLAVNCLAPVYASSAYVAGVEDMMVKFPGTNVQWGISGLSLYLLGQAFGPLVWAPLSEVEAIGRRLTFLISFPPFVLFNLAGAVSQDMASILVVRFFAGFFGSAQLSNLAAEIADNWVPHERMIPAGLAALSPRLGPVLGPSIGGFVAECAGWRALFWMQFGFALVMLILWLFFVPETYAPMLILRKTKLLQSRETGKIYQNKYAGSRKTIWQKLKIGLSRPIILLFTEVIVLTLSIYISIIYGILYLLFTAYPVVFQELRGWSLGLTGLALFGIGIGMIIGFFLNGMGSAIYARARARLPPGQLPPPEIRLPTMILGGILGPIGLFIFAWTSTPNVPWAVPVIFSSFFGMGYLLIFISILLYLIDSYSLHAASAIAANSVLRCMFGAAFPLFADSMFDALGVHWAGSLLGFLSLACVPLPFLFYRYCAILRRKSKYAPSSPSEKKDQVTPSADPTVQRPVTPRHSYAPNKRESHVSLVSARAPNITDEEWSPPGNDLHFPPVRGGTRSRGVG